MIFIACAIGVYGEGGAACLSLVLFFESCIFPTIFTLSIRGLGKDTKRGSSWIVASVCGGALFPAVTGLAADNLGTYHKAMFVPLLGKQRSKPLEYPRASLTLSLGFLVAFSFPIYLNTVCAKELDGFRETQIGFTDEHDGTVIGGLKDVDVNWEKSTNDHDSKV